jgi:hypothetical protein
VCVSCRVVLRVRVVWCCVQILNFALTLELLDSRFFVEGLNNFTAADFEAAGFPNTTFGFITRIRDNELAHASALQSAIGSGRTSPPGPCHRTAIDFFFFFACVCGRACACAVVCVCGECSSLGGTPVQQCNYSFPISNVTQFVEIAQRLENVGVSAYDGTLAFLTSPQLQTTGATIASVEARHAAYLNLLRGMIPFPNALDTPLPISTVLDPPPALSRPPPPVTHPNPCVSCRVVSCAPGTGNHGRVCGVVPGPGQPADARNPPQPRYRPACECDPVVDCSVFGQTRPTRTLKKRSKMSFIVRACGVVRVVSCHKVSRRGLWRVAAEEGAEAGAGRAAPLESLELIQLA